MKIQSASATSNNLPPFTRNFAAQPVPLTAMGTGGIGGKAQGLAFINDVLAQHFADSPFPGLTVTIPTMTVMTTDIFDAFMERNNLYDHVRGGVADRDIAEKFQQANLPAEILGDLRSIVNTTKNPLAIRSSSMLEDAMYEPFAGVYATKMIPNNQPSPDDRFRKLIEAIRFVYASTFFRSARNYLRMTKHPESDEKMAIIIQEVVGQQVHRRFYPHISGVARSYNFYPVGHAKREDGVVTLALGLGRTIVDGGNCWSFSPQYPRAVPPFNSIRDLIKMTQTTYWAVNVGGGTPHNPLAETEYLVEVPIAEADLDGTIKYLASTYVAQSDRLVLGTGQAGPRVLTFAPILVLNELPLTQLVKKLLKICEDAVGHPVEIEFALTLDNVKAYPARLGFLQVRPMVISDEQVTVASEELTAPNVLLASTKVMGNGVFDTIKDVVFVKPETFDSRYSLVIAQELELINKRLVDQGKPYLLIGFGRWGSSDHWLGIPVTWDQISGAKVIVETTLGSMNVEASQGSHFFHNITSFKVGYFTIHHADEHPIKWEWLAARRTVTETAYLNHVELAQPLLIKVDGRTGRGVVSYDRE